MELQDSVIGAEFIGIKLPIIRAIKQCSNAIDILQDLLDCNNIEAEIEPLDKERFTIYHSSGESTTITYLSAFLKPKKFLKYAIKVSNAR